MGCMYYKKINTSKDIPVEMLCLKKKTQKAERYKVQKKTGVQQNSLIDESILFI